MSDHDAVSRLSYVLADLQPGEIVGRNLVEVLAQIRDDIKAEEAMPVSGPSLPSIPVNGADMVVHVVMPGGNVLTLANSEPPTPQALEPFSERDKRIMRTLLLAASDELVGQYDYGYSYGAQQPMPAFPVAPRPVKP